MSKKVTKVSKPKVDEHQYSLSINEPLLYLLQQSSGDSTFKIINHFYDIMLKQRAEIELTASGKNDKNKYHRIQQKKSYGYYPGTDAYCIICTTKKDHDLNGYGSYGYGAARDHTLWECNVSLIRGAVKYDHEAIKKMMAEGILLGDAAVTPITAPHLKKLGRRDDLSALESLTDSTEEV